MSSADGAPAGLDDDQKLIWQYFHEFPKESAAIAGLSLYILATLLVFIATVKTRTWYMLVVVLTGVLEVVGFSARLGFLRQPSRNQFIIMQCTLVISPVLLAIVNYMTVGRLVSRTEAGKGTRLARWLAVAFTASDILCLCLQGAGGAMMTSTNPNTVNIAQYQLLTGLGLQLVFFAIFTGFTIHVQRSPRYGYVAPDRPMRWVFVCLYVTIALMFIRNIFRVAEFAMGFHGYLATHEEFFYVFDFVPIFSCFLCYTFWHFGYWLGQGAAAYPMLLVTDTKVVQVAAGTQPSQQPKQIECV